MTSHLNSQNNNSCENFENIKKEDGGRDNVSVGSCDIRESDLNDIHVTDDVGRSISDSDITKHEIMDDETNLVLSILYGLFMVVLAIVFKVSENITHGSKKISSIYLCVLFVIAIVWLGLFKCYTTWWRSDRSFQKSPRASNKWLKGVIALFGFAIVVKDCLELLGATEITDKRCADKLVYFFSPIFHSMYTLGQVVFLFFYAKIHMQEFTYLARFAIMHFIATNLSVWIGIIADETSHALEYEEEHHALDSVVDSPQYTTSMPVNFQPLVDIVEENCNSTSDIFTHFNVLGFNSTITATSAAATAAGYYSGGTSASGGLFSGKCWCGSDVCKVIGKAEKFLSPLLIEFCLVSSCLLYITWSHVGKPIKHYRRIAKPSHKFYKCYKGVLFGAIMLVASVIVITLLGTLNTGVPSHTQSYYTEFQTLIIYEAFLLSCNLLMLAACFFAFYVYYISKIQRADTSVGLDIVLLFICLVGPLLVGIFSVLSFTTSSTTYPTAYGWQLSLIYSLSEIIVSIVQILLIVHGLNREPAVARLFVSEPNDNRLQAYDNVFSQGKNEELTSDNKMQKVNHSFENQDDHSNAETSLSAVKEDSVIKTRLDSSDWNEVKRSPADVAVVRSRSPNQVVCDNCSAAGQNAFAPIGRERIILRDVIMFLVLANTCVWILLSLNGTAFKVFPYQLEYFGHSAWTTLASVTAPLSIFLKLHSAACFFEIWSYS